MFHIQFVIAAVSLFFFSHCISSDDIVADCGITPSAWYDGDSYDDTDFIWYDKSGNGADARGEDVIGGENIVKGSFGSRTCLHIPSTTTLMFPVHFGDDYTIFNVAAYEENTNANRHRVLTGFYSNWFSGFHGGFPGVASHGAWVHSILDDDFEDYENNWVFSSDQSHYYSCQSYDEDSDSFTPRSSVTSTSSLMRGPEGNVYINAYANEKSDLRIAEVVMFVSKLTKDEMECVENFLADKYAPDASAVANPLSVLPAHEHHHHHHHHDHDHDENEAPDYYSVTATEYWMARTNSIYLVTGLVLLFVTNVAFCYYKVAKFPTTKRVPVEFNDSRSNRRLTSTQLWSDDTSASSSNIDEDQI